MAGLGRSVCKAEGFVPSLAQLSLAALAKQISQEPSARDVAFLPSELATRLLTSLGQQGLITNDTLNAIASPNLQTLDFSNATPTCKIDNSTLAMISRSGQFVSLRFLDLSSCLQISGLGIKQIISACLHLETLSLAGCRIGDSTFDFRKPHSFACVGQKRKPDALPETCPALKKQKLAEDCQFAPTNETVETRKMLTSLSLSGCPVTTQGLIHISSLFPNLRVFDCSHNESILDIIPILHGCRSLRSLTLNGCNLNQYQPFFDPNVPLLLEEISFSGFGYLYPNFYDLLVYLAPQLRSLRIRNKTWSLENVEDPTVWLQSCSRLEVLDLYEVPVGLPMLKMLCDSSAKTLTLLDITRSRGLRDADFLRFSQTDFPNLKSFSLNQAASFPHMPEIGRRCPKLEHLCFNLDPKSLLSEGDIPMILSGLRHLSELELWSCTSVSLPTLDLIMDSCPQLASLLYSTAQDGRAHQIVDPGPDDLEDELPYDEEIPMDEFVDEMASIDEDALEPLQDPHDGMYQAPGFPQSENGSQLEARPRHQAVQAVVDPSHYLSEDEFNDFVRQYPQVTFKMWHHNAFGCRHFRYHKGFQTIEEFEKPVKLNQLSVVLKSTEGSGMTPSVLVDNIPIWTNESPASLQNLRSTLQGGENAGAIPIVSDWCCECNIENFNGLLYYHDEKNHQITWETHEPGEKKTFHFDYNQYAKALQNVRVRVPPRISGL